jgi:Ni2+-binding GTPase involved in maturation of urease and hydrogenase
MNILIFGRMASGKTIIARALAQHYRRLGQRVDIIEDDRITSSRAEYIKRVNIAKAILIKTKGKIDRHTIITTQAESHQILGFYKTEDIPQLYDYYCETSREEEYSEELRALE